MSDDADFGQLADDLSAEDLRIVLGVFATDVKRLTGNLNAAAAAEDVGTFKRVAHGLAGAAGAVGAKALEQACRIAMARAESVPPRLHAVAEAIDALADSALVQLATYTAQLDGAKRETG